MGTEGEMQTADYRLFTINCFFLNALVIMVEFYTQYKVKGAIS